jgi:DNA mismatch endonuclease (patch repair protein)
MTAVPSYKQFSPASAAASRAKRANRSEGGRAEQLLRQTLWREGLRFRKHVQGLPGRPDVVFLRPKLCVFCDGDFWHGRNWPELREQLQRGANAEYWEAKIGRNIERDREQTRLLQSMGWRVLRLWETDVMSDPDAAVMFVRQALVQPAGT